MTHSTNPKNGRRTPHSSKTSKHHLLPLPNTKMSTSEQGLRFNFSWEAQKGVSNRLYHPSSESGVTIGPGYDMKERPQLTIKDDLVKIGVAADTAILVSKASGLHGEDARVFCKKHKKLVNLSSEQEIGIQKLIIPKYEAIVKRNIHILLNQFQFDALVSFCYNPGGSFVGIAHKLDAGKENDAFFIMRSRNKSGGEIKENLVLERFAQIMLYKTGKYLDRSQIQKKHDYDN